MKRARTAREDDDDDDDDGGDDSSSSSPASSSPPSSHSPPCTSSEQAGDDSNADANDADAQTERRLRALRQAHANEQVALERARDDAAARATRLRDQLEQLDGLAAIEEDGGVGGGNGDDNDDGDDDDDDDEPTALLRAQLAAAEQAEREARQGLEELARRADREVEAVLLKRGSGAGAADLLQAQVRRERARREGEDAPRAGLEAAILGGGAADATGAAGALSIGSDKGRRKRQRLNEGRARVEAWLQGEEEQQRMASAVADGGGGGGGAATALAPG